MQQQRIGLFPAYGAFWKNYANFRSRTSKEAFWKAWVLHIAFLLAGFSPMYYAYYRRFEFGDMSAIFLLLPMIFYSLATVIPTIAIIVRRLHDTDRHGAYFLLFLIPYAGQIIFFIMLTRPSAPFDVFPGLAGSGPYGYSGSYAPPQNPYAPQQPYSRPHYPYGQPQGSYVQQSYYAPTQSPYGQSPPQQTPYGHPQSPYSQNPYAPPPYGGQQGSYGSSYAQQPYWRSTLSPYQRALPPPRGFAPQAGGNMAMPAIALSIILTVTLFVYSNIVSAYQDDNTDRYYDSFFGNGYPFDYGLDDYNNDYGEQYPDYGSGDDWGGYDDYDTGSAPLTAEEQEAVDFVKEGSLDGFPEFTIEEVLLSRVDEYGLEWYCYKNTSGDAEDYVYNVCAIGYEAGGYDSIYAEFDVYDDGWISIYNIEQGRLDEYEEDALDLYRKWYESILSSGSNTTAV
jgi:uncharacterized membrane protein YhaH (DUF805 family)